MIKENRVDISPLIDPISKKRIGTKNITKNATPGEKSKLFLTDTKQMLFRRFHWRVHSKNEIEKSETFEEPDCVIL